MSEDFVGVLGDNTEENTELFEHFRIVADKGQTLVRVDKVLQNRLENVSRNRVQNAAKAGKKALGMFTVSDHILTGEALSAEERQNSFTQMMEVALKTAVELG